MATTAQAQPPPQGEAAAPTAVDPGEEERAELRRLLSAAEQRVSELESSDAERDRRLEEAINRLSVLEAQGAAQEQELGEHTTRLEEVDTEPLLRPLASMFTRFEHREGYWRVGFDPATAGCGRGDSDCLRFRARAGFVTRELSIGEGLSAAVRFLPQASGHWAMSGSGGLTDLALDLYEGALLLRAGWLRLEIGRFEMIYGEHLIIGNVGWHPTGRAFDGVRAHIQPEENGYWIDAFWTILSEGDLPTFGESDRYFYGLYAGLGALIDEAFTLDVYALGLQSNATRDELGNTMDAGARVTLGVRSKYKVGIFDYRVEAGLQTGVEPSGATIAAFQGDAEVGLSFLEGRVRVGLLGLFATGPSRPSADPAAPAMSTAWNQLFPTAHKFLGLSDVIGGRSDIASGVLRLSAQPIDALRLNLDAHLYARPEGASPSGSATALMGGELNLEAGYTLGAGLAARAMYAIFFPNADWYGGSGDPVHYLEVELSYTLR